MEIKHRLFISLFCLTTLSFSTANASVSTASCTIDGQGNLKGNYNAPQEMTYSSSCILNMGQDTSLVPIGNNAKGTGSRILVGKASDGRINYVETYLNDASDNTLSGGRGRAELSTCFVTDTAFAALPEMERNFRERAADVNRQCRTHLDTSPVAQYSFSIIPKDSLQSPKEQWDVIIAQLHAIPDKDLYCIPLEGNPKNSCYDVTGTVSRVQRHVDAYNQKIANGAIFEGGVQPPLSFRIKDGKFMIVATSSKTNFSPAVSCNLRASSAEIMKTKVCTDIEKTITVLYREDVEKILPSNKETHFIIRVQWSHEDGPQSGHLTVTAQRSDTELMTLVNDWKGPVGTNDAAYPYLKVGIYRHGNNGVPTRLRYNYVRQEWLRKF